MNIFKKPDKNIVTLYLEEKDFQSPYNSLRQSLIDILSEIEGKEVKFKMNEIKDIHLQALHILLSFFKSASLQNSHIVLEAESAVIDGILQIGIGGLGHSFEMR
ncbi:MAG: hypothetical protein KBF99_08035 [Leptospiraceae bacterium]|jgi:hypothetical protein|nr:hypothetical protein [Leptospiraceae bacterium]MBK7056047.1 hypothetical protein [Leptospiraceae bacterium]MBK9498069.1 hypothetical protein [Leptospiraceae bacterium]MBL0265360.1 hypothetical protein [Leptospiraceae bacterium]MBP9163117.1 hypothetical protein [Leptospiraceae bacterium]